MLNHDKMAGAGSAADTIDFMKQMWGSVGTPPMMMPSLSVEDINKKITDLKTVGSWLELNLNMLKATIQTMEVQSATLSTLQAMSAIMASREQGGDPEAAPAAPAFPFGFPLWPGNVPAAASDEDKDDQPPAEPLAREPEPEPEPEPEIAAGGPAPVTDPDAAPAVDFQAAIGNPNAWWNLLQDQFKQAVDSAMAGTHADQEPRLKPAKPGSAVRSKNKTVAPKVSKKGAAGAVKSRPKSASKSITVAKKAEKSVISSSTVGKQHKVTKNTSASGGTGVVQSGQNKKPAPRKPTSP